jgi:hypothetical protein
MRPSRSGGSVAHNATSSLPTVTLTQDGDGNLNWTTSGSSPFDWDIQNSDDGITGWIDDAVVPGSTRAWPVDSGNTYYRLWGRDSGGSPITQVSNVVLVSGA